MATVIFYGSTFRTLNYSRNSLISVFRREQVAAQGSEYRYSIPRNPVLTTAIRASSSPISSVLAATAAALLFSVVGLGDAHAVDLIGTQQQAAETLENVPQILSSECLSSPGQQADCKKPRIQRPKSRKAESCTIKCVTTCIRGGLGSPGEGPLNVRRPLVVFKQGFRSRQYCLAECSDICNLIKEGDDGP